MLAFASGTSSATWPAVIAAAGSVVSALLLAWVAVRAQSARQQLEEIRRIFEDAIEKATSDPARVALVNDRIKRALREVLGEDPRNRRWYDHEE